MSAGLRTEEPPSLGLPETPINIGSLHVRVHCDLKAAADNMVVCAKSLLKFSDCDNDTLWKLEEAFRVLANITDRLESDEPAITAAERNLGHVRSE